MSLLLDLEWFSRRLSLLRSYMVRSVMKGRELMADLSDKDKAMLALIDAAEEVNDTLGDLMDAITNRAGQDRVTSAVLAAVDTRAKYREASEHWADIICKSCGDTTS